VAAAAWPAATHPSSNNCEHLIDACARTITELRGLSRGLVLATSRKPLRIEGEISWRTPSLDLPDRNIFRH
jgi:predicted ATPase